MHDAKPTIPLTPEQAQVAAKNQGLVWRAARKFQYLGIDLEDLVGWGQFGLLHACRQYDPNIARFSTYATVCIRYKIIQALKEQSRTIRVPKNLQTNKNRSTFEIYQAVTERDLATPLAQLAVQGESTDPLKEAEKEARLAALLGSLDSRSAQVLRLHFGIGTKRLTLAEVGSKFQLSKERVRQIQDAALEQLRQQVGALA